MFWRIGKFATDAGKHIAAGSPKCPQAAIDERYRVCVACEEYDSGRGMCRVCECHCGRELKFLNKLAWADQTCPLLKWDEYDARAD